jgi:hypothetical protein
VRQQLFQGFHPPQNLHTRRHLGKLWNRQGRTRQNDLVDFSRKKAQ